LIEAGELFDVVVAVVTIYALVKDVERKKLHYLRENDFSGIHR
jgi:molybdenum cofactor biosynthesis enzyme